MITFRFSFSLLSKNILVKVQMHDVLIEDPCITKYIERDTLAENSPTNEVKEYFRPFVRSLDSR